MQPFPNNNQSIEEAMAQIRSEIQEINIKKSFKYDYDFVNDRPHSKSRRFVWIKENNLKTPRHLSNIHSDLSEHNKENINNK